MHRIISLSLAFLLLVGSVGVTVNRHFCMGELKSIALFGAAETCHEAEVATCPMHASPAKKKCCDDEHELLISDDDRQLVDAPVLPVGLWVMTNPPAPLFPEFSLHLRPRPNKTFEQYRPPPKLIDAPRHFQVFRL